MRSSNVPEAFRRTIIVAYVASEDDQCDCVTYSSADRFDLPFTTLSGLVDCDRYKDTWVHFPAHWHDRDFEGVIPKGTPIAQCIPVRRENWSAQISCFTEEEARRVSALQHQIRREPGLYRRNFRT